MSPHTIATNTIAPLPLRVEPRPWEDLHSFLTRTATRMHYERVTQVIQPELSPHHIAVSQISLLTEQADYALLSRLFLLSEEALYQMTLHQFSTPFAHLDLFPIRKNDWNPKQNLYLQPQSTTSRSPIQKPRLTKGPCRSFFLPSQITQICPLCLQEDVPYDRLYWKARYLLTCHTHAILLLRHCPICQKRIPAHRLDPLSCPFCHHPYLNTWNEPPLPLPPDVSCLSNGDLLTLRALGISLTDLTLSSTSSPAHDPRASLPPEQYFSLMRAICLSLHPLPVDHFRTFLPPAVSTFLDTHQLLLHTHPDKVPPLHVAAAHWIFSQWPTHFFHFLDALEHWSWNAKKRKKHAFYDFPHRLMLGTQAHEAYTFLSQAYRQYQTTFPWRTRDHRIQQRLAAYSIHTSSPS